MNLNEMQPPLGQTYVSNIEQTLASGKPVEGAYAQKVREISPRSVWYPEYDTVALPTEPDPAFTDYAASLGREPRIVVPKGINPQKLSIRDGFGDPELQKVIQGRFVSYYMGDRALYGLVEAYGGQYEGGDPENTVTRVNDKARYAQYANSIVDVVDGKLSHGVAAIARTVWQELDNGSVYVRHTEAGGGLGNRTFHANGSRPNLDQIVTHLNGDQPHLWRNGKALVEPYLRFVSSPAVTFDTQTGFRYSNRQITVGNDYIGCWSPVPEWEIPTEALEDIGNGFARRLDGEGYAGIANTDLGLSDDGRVFGFEINGRTPGSRHAIAVGERLLGPWRSWLQEGVAIKTLDKTYLRHPATFSELHGALHAAGLLATTDEPFGAVITIPPAGDIAGIQVHGRGYTETEELHRKILELVGHPTKNKEDHPLEARAAVRS